MPMHNLAPEQWTPYFEAVRRHLRGRTAYVEASGLRLARRSQEEWLPLMGIRYDQQRDLLDVTTEGLEHCISQPREIRVQDDADGLERVEVFDAAGLRQVLVLREPIPLRDG
jgi:hypothetical protein